MHLKLNLDNKPGLFHIPHGSGKRTDVPILSGQTQTHESMMWQVVRIKPRYDDRRNSPHECTPLGRPTPKSCSCSTQPAHRLGPTSRRVSSLRSRNRDDLPANNITPKRTCALASILHFCFFGLDFPEPKMATNGY